jgi:small subunit ribosomal protein S5
MNIIISNYFEKILQIKRVTKVVKGGKIMTFRVVLVVGDKINKVGLGIGHSEDVNLAIEKASLNGKKNLITVPITYSYSIPHVIYMEYGASKIMLKPVKIGTGLISGGAIRTVIELSGIKNISSKQFGSSNLLNNAKATILALMTLTKKLIF